MLKVILSTVWSYGDYFPPNYDVDFYEVVSRTLLVVMDVLFITISFPAPLTRTGLLLISDRFRRPSRSGTVNWPVPGRSGLTGRSTQWTLDGPLCSVRPHRQRWIHHVGPCARWVAR